ncbi:AarF/ABC1/UbiB kinase family protein [Mycobacterium sp. CBMA271]|nr:MULTISPECIES: AarF/ABC1/UbiB kinase family protein [unclassified Mycobacteroides]MUM17734.1 ABC transporter [Mycobacteroides sp. CBMA 326]MUM22991.1 AarF/ABC1/UbiB kinase family protein [Mycobacteroides sp. CBMA 271]
MPLAGFTARAAGGRLVAGIREKAGDVGAVRRFHEHTAEQYAEYLGHSKGVLMKVGQMLSMVDMAHIGEGNFSPYQKALSRLQADAPPMAPQLARDVLEADLGRTVEEIFAEFSDEPMAAASIGQVHRAVLHDGRQVAVKIQYPGVAQAIRDDLANTELVTTFMRLGMSATGIARVDLREMAEEIAARISEEVDYRYEAASITAFSELYRAHPFIRVPELIPEACGDKVLTMTFVEGLDWAAAQEAGQELKDSWGEVIWRFVGGSLCHSNLFHADPHPGNYRFGTDGSVGIVDFGCVRRYTEVQRRQIVDLMFGMGYLKPDEWRHLMVKGGFIPTDSTISAEDAYSWMAEAYQEFLAPQPVTYDRETADRSARRTFSIGDPRVRQFTVPGEHTYFGRITFGINIILGTLGCTFHARGMIEDLAGLADPVSPLGIQHRAWVLERGLPFGLDDHEEHRQRASRIG